MRRKWANYSKRNFECSNWRRKKYSNWWIKEDVAEKLSKAEVKISEASKAAKPRPKAKKESSGFNLFGFMNGSKNKNEQEETDFEEEEEEEKSKPVKKSAPKEVKVSESKLQEVAAKKHQEFFGGATIFDEEKEDEADEKVEEDMLNVPAFFRRKK